MPTSRVRHQRRRLGWFFKVALAVVLTLSVLLVLLQVQLSHENIGIGINHEHAGVWQALGLRFSGVQGRASPTEEPVEASSSDKKRIEGSPRKKSHTNISAKLAELKSRLQAQHGRGQDAHQDRWTGAMKPPLVGTAGIQKYTRQLAKQPQAPAAGRAPKYPQHPAAGSRANKQRPPSPRKFSKEQCLLEPRIPDSRELLEPAANAAMQSAEEWKTWHYTCSYHAKRAVDFLKSSAQRCTVEETHPKRWRMMLGQAEAPFSLAQRYADVSLAVHIISRSPSEKLWGAVGWGNKNPSCSVNLSAVPMELSKYANRAVTVRGMLCEKGKEALKFNDALPGRWIARQICIGQDLYGGNTCNKSPPLPPPSTSPLLDALASKRSMSEAYDLLQAALERLDRLLHSRATLCNAEQRCFVRQWPCNKTAKARSFFSFMPSSRFPPEEREKDHPDLKNSDCLLICTAPLAFDQIRTSVRSDGDIWEYILSKDGLTCREPDTVTKDKVCRTGCYLYDLRKLAEWRKAKVKRGPFYSREDAEKAKWPKDVLQFVPEARTFPQQSLKRCAVMGSSHAIKCGSSWGPAIDQEYSAVFRVNDGDAKVNMKPCKAGTRTDFHIDFRRNESKGETKWLVRAPPCSMIIPTIIKPDDLPHLNHIRRNSPRTWKVLMPNAVGHSWGQGSGSGAIAQAVALSLCRSVDVFGYGLFKGEDNDLRYIHHYDKIPTFNQSGHEVMQSELRNIVFDAFGLWNFIWW